MLVYIAEGHGRRPDGSFDPGAIDGIHSEQRDSKPVAEACTQTLRSAGVDVVSESDLSDDPNFYGTTARANAEGVDAVVSFHYDWREAPPGAFAIATTDDGRELGWAIEARVEKAGFAIRDYPDDRDGLYLLDNSHAPAVIFECGRIGHEDIDETHEQERMGEAAGRGILDWLGLEQLMFVAADGRNGWAKQGPTVEYWQHFLRKLDPSYDPGVGGWGDATSPEFAEELAKFSPGPPVIGPGEKLALEIQLTQKFGADGSVDSTARKIARAARDRVAALVGHLRRS